MSRALLVSLVATCSLFPRAASAEVPLETFAQPVSQQEIDEAFEGMSAGADELGRALAQAAAQPSNPLGLVLVRPASGGSCPIRLRVINPGSEPLFAVSMLIRQARTEAELDGKLVCVLALASGYKTKVLADPGAESKTETALEVHRAFAAAFESR